MSSQPPESDPRHERHEPDERPEPPEPLESDRTSTVDPRTLRFQGVSAQEQSETTDAGRLSAEDQATIKALRPGTALLVVLRGPNSGARFLLDDEQVVAGRHPDSDIFLDDVTVSRKHAVFSQAASGYAVLDAGSLNGTYVNRHLVDQAALQTGDEVQVGKFRLVYYAAG